VKLGIDLDLLSKTETPATVVIAGVLRLWWEVVDLNHWSHWQQIYRLYWYTLSGIKAHYCTLETYCNNTLFCFSILFRFISCYRLCGTFCGTMRGTKSSRFFGFL